MLLNLEDLLNEFSSSTLSKAHGIRRDKKVLSLQTSEDGAEIWGKVRGSYNETYVQEIVLDLEDETLFIEGACTCPVGYNCKHVAALLLEQFEQRAKSGVNRYGRVRIGPVKTVKAPLSRPAPVTLPRELDAWVSRAKRSTSKEKKFSTNNRLLYILSTPYSNEQRRVVLELQAGKLTKQGGYVEVKPFEKTNLHSLPQYAQAEIDLIRTIQACTSSQYAYDFSQFVLDDGELTQILLRKLLATERLFWQKVKGDTLRLGKHRPGAPAWRVLKDGSQQATLDITPLVTATLPLTPPWYVDNATGEMGVVEPTVPTEQAKVFLTCPPVTPEVVGVFEKTLRETLGTRFPAPKPVEVKRERPRCIPRLTLQSIVLPSWYGSSETLTDTAKLEFAYNDTVIPATEQGETVSVYRDGVLSLLERNLNTERAAQKELLALDLMPAGRFSYHLPEDKKHHFTLLEHERDAPGRWLDIVTEVLPKLKKQGWQVYIDKSFRHQVVEPDDWYGELEESDEGWFGLELGVLIDGKQVSLIPLLVTMLQQMPQALSKEALNAMPDDDVVYVPYENKQLALPVARVRSILGILIELYLKDALTDGELRLPMLDAARLLELEDALALRWMGGDRLRELGQKLRDFEGIELAEPPAGLKAELRPYQQQGLSWLQFLRDYELNGVLADDMGLGKTLQTLSHLLTEKEAGRVTQPSLVVAPTSLMNTWYSEAKRFTPELKVLVLHGKERKAHFDSIPDYDLILTTYPLIPRDIDELKKHSYHLLALDEAQYVKNPRTNAFKGVAALNAKHRLCLSGTPLENHLGELWALFHFLMPGFLGSREQFRQLYRTPIERHADDERQKQLVKRVRPFILRRTKSEVAKELPPKTETVVSIDLEGAQRDLYETLRVAMHERVRSEIDKRGLARSQIMVLDALLKLRQACCDPRLVKVESAKKVKKSAKLEWLKDTLPSFVEDGRKVLIFSQFSTLLGLLETTLQDLNIRYAKLTGQTQDRAAQIEHFQNGDAQVFLITLKAGGVGLNLTAADTVIHFDPWWNPAAENQATDRAHRIGQEKPVFVYKLIASGSIEEKILKLQERKAALAAGILSGSLSQAVSLTQEDVQSLFEPLEAEADGAEPVGA